MSVVNITKLETAGLPKEGIWGATVGFIEERTQTSKAGEEYSFVLVRWALEEFYGDGSGEVETPSYSDGVWDRFYLRGKALARYAMLIQATTGELPTGERGEDGEFSMDNDSILDAVRGGKAYIVVKHGPRIEGKTRQAEVDWKITPDPSKLRFVKADA